jgi:hypothetical protein
MIASWRVKIERVVRVVGVLDSFLGTFLFSSSLRLRLLLQSPVDTVIDTRVHLFLEGTR